MGKISDALEKVQTPPERRGQEKKVTNNRDQGAPAVLETYKAPSTSERPAQKSIRSNQATESKPQAPSAAISEQPVRSPLLPSFDRQAINAKLIAITAPDSYEAEQFRMLRTNILFPKSGQIARNIMIASTAPAEGKSFVAANLAISVAQNIDKHVLLIDCDMRKPSIHDLFGFGPLPGLSDYLQQGTPLPSLMRKTFIERLSILPGGTPPPNPSELLSSGRMAALLKEVRQRYSDRFIIIDTPPIQLTAEAHALAKFTDGVILVVRFGRTNKELVAEVIKKIGKDKLLGVTGNFSERQSVYKGYADRYYGYPRKPLKT